MLHAIDIPLFDNNIHLILYMVEISMGAKSGPIPISYCEFYMYLYQFSLSSHSE